MHIYAVLSACGERKGYKLAYVVIFTLVVGVLARNIFDYSHSWIQSSTDIPQKMHA